MQASKQFSFLTLGCLAVLAFFSSPSMACSCIPSHPQTSYCNADYVVGVRILKKSKDLVRKQVVNEVEIKKSYKMTPKGNETLRYGLLRTPLEGSSCHINLEVGKLYVIAAGNGSQVNLCNYVKEHQNMSMIEEKGFSGEYNKTCSCEVRPFENSDLKQVESSSGCNWSPLDKCETELSACTPYRIPRSLFSQCRWSRSTDYETCVQIRKNNTTRYINI